MVKEKAYYNESELNEFKELILEKLQRANEKLVSFRTQLSDFSADNKVKSYEDSSDSYDTGQLAEMLSREEKHIIHLENALVRIKNNVYGICRETGKLISRERLMMVPHATLSMEAKSKSSK